MIWSRRKVLASALAAGGALLRSTARATASSVAVEHARVHTGDGRTIDDGTLVTDGDRVVAVGASTDVAAVAARATLRIDGRGLEVTPGLFDAESQTGLVDVHLEPSTSELALDERYDAVRAAFRVLDGWNPRSAIVPVTRMEGVTAVALAPRQGLVAGAGAVVRLAASGGAGVPAHVVRAPSAIYASVAGGGRAAAYGARGGVHLRLRELLEDVRQYARRRPDFERNDMRRLAASRLDLEALVPVVERKLRLVLDVQRAADIEAALRFAREERVDVVLAGCEEGWIVADAIREAGVPVILSATPNLPRSFETLAARLENAALLAAAGVPVALSPREKDEHLARTLRFEAGNAASHGLAWQTALAAVTSVPARIFGVDDRLGTLAPGKSADFVVWSGDPFEPLTRVRHVFVAGQSVPLRSRQTELRDRYARTTKR